MHKAGHFFWRFHDRGHPEFTDAEPELLDSLRAMYEQMDRALGSVLDALDGKDDLIVVTDRGMYADHGGDHLVEAILLKLCARIGGNRDNRRAATERPIR